MKNEKTPRIAYIKLFERCNANCVMCDYAGQIDNFTPDIIELKILLKSIFDNGIREVRFTGGEPLLYHKLIEAISFAHSLGLKTSIITNGYLLKEKAKELVDSKVDRIICSIDSSFSKIHNSLRRKKNIFENAIEGIKIIKQQSDVSIVINTVLSNKNCNYLVEMDSFIRELNVEYWNIIPVKQCQELELNDREKAMCISRIKELKKNNSAIVVDEEVLYSPKGNMDYCNIPNYVLFIDLKNQIISPCNCLSHLDNNIFCSFFNEYDISEYLNSKLYKDTIENAAYKCKCLYGKCDPINRLFSDESLRKNNSIEKTDFLYLFCN